MSKCLDGFASGSDNDITQHTKSLCYSPGKFAFMCIVMCIVVCVDLCAWTFVIRAHVRGGCVCGCGRVSMVVWVALKPPSRKEVVSQPGINRLSSMMLMPFHG